MSGNPTSKLSTTQRGADQMEARPKRIRDSVRRKNQLTNQARSTVNLTLPMGRGGGCVQWSSLTSWGSRFLFSGAGFRWVVVVVVVVVVVRGWYCFVLQAASGLLLLGVRVGVCWRVERGECQGCQSSRILWESGIQAGCVRVGFLLGVCVVLGLSFSWSVSLGCLGFCLRCCLGVCLRCWRLR
jgi:hypothetical protein